MKRNPSRRTFLAVGLAAPASGPAGAAPGAPAPYATLGRTGLKVSRLSFGCMLTSDASVIERAADLGVNHFDTARVYGRGNNERMVGAALKSRRKKVIIATKTLNTSDRGSALADLETSLKTLGTDYVDIWYLHDKRSAAEITGGLMEAQQEARKTGKIRFTGLSVHSNHRDVIPAAIASGQIDVLLTTYNFAMDAGMEALLASARRSGMGVVAMKVMAGSFRLENFDYDRARKAVKRPGGAVAALKWVLRNPNVDCAVPSMTDRDQLEENLAAASVPFDPADGELLEAQLHHIRPLYCRACGSCEGSCARGLPVQDMLRYLMYADGYGRFAFGREHFLALPPQVASIRCADCSACTVECPNGVRVAERLARAQQLFA